MIKAQPLPAASPTDLAPTEGPRLNSKLFLPFVEAARKVFSTMMKLDVAIDKPFIKENSDATYDVSGIIGFYGDMVGSMAISFESQSAGKFVAAFTSIEVETSSADFSDAVAELANIIAGDAKKDLGGIVNITTPTVVTGHGHAIARLSGVPCVVIPCRTPVGNFTVELNIKPSK